MTETEVKKILAILQPLWPPTGLDKLAVPAWMAAMRKQDSGLLQEAAAEWMETPGQRFMPRPGELISLANDIRDQQVRDGIRSLPTPVQAEYVNTAEDYERALRIEKMAAEMNITLRPSWHRLIEEAHAWQAAQERGIA